MKKLAIAFAAIAMAVCAQAASVQWSFTETAQTAKNPLDISAYTAYLFTDASWTTVLASDIGAGIDKKAFLGGYSDSIAMQTASVGGGKGVTYKTGTVTSELESRITFMLSTPDAPRRPLFLFRVFNTSSILMPDSFIT